MKKKLLAVMLIVVMVLASAATVFAAEKDHGHADGAQIAINGAIEGQTYAAYRVFEAVPSATGDAVTYKMLPGKTMPQNDYFTVDSLGNVSSTDAAKDSAGKLSTGAVEWLKANYATLGEYVDEVTADANGAVLKNMPYGYYYVTSTTGTVVSVDTTNKNATIEEKNETSEFDKSIEEASGSESGEHTSFEAGDGDWMDSDKAMAQIGTAVNFDSRFTVPKGAINFVFTDTMQNTLDLDADSIKVYVVDAKDAEPAAGATPVEETADTFAIEYPQGKTFQITFQNAWIANQVGKTVVIKYDGILNKDAVITAAGNENRARIDYGNGDNKLWDEDYVKVYTGKITVMKYDGSAEDEKPLAGAGFVLYRMNGTAKEYYQWANDKVNWVVSEADATEFFSGADGKLVGEFKGLHDGTYYLHEKTVPAGYNAIADETVVIGTEWTTGGFDVNCVKDEPVENNKGNVMPATGGMGTTILYTLGGILVVGAGVLLVARRKMDN